MRFSKEGTSSALRNESDAISFLGELVKSDPLRSVLTALEPKGHPHIVGGTIRDVLQGFEPADFDIATLLLPQEVTHALEGRGIRVVETGLKHGTVTAVVSKYHIEITTFRVPGPHGSNKFSSSIEEDLSGRDFTINAIAYSVQNRTLIDPHGGQEDLRAQLLRTVGEARDRFSEDSLRILRMIRFGPAEGREVAQATKDAVRELGAQLGQVSAERIQQELRKIVSSPHPRAAFFLLKELDLLGLLLPEMLPSIGCEQNEFHTEDVFEHTLSVVERCPREGLLRWCALFHDLGKPATLTVGEDGRRHFYEHEILSATLAERALTRLRFSHDDIKEIVTLVRHHMRPIEVGPSGLRRIMRDTGEFFNKWRRFKVADAPPVMAEDEVARRMAHFDEMVATELRRIEKQGNRLAVNGEDLKQIGFTEGKALGQALKTLEEIVIEDPRQNEKSILLARAADLLSK